MEQPLSITEATTLAQSHLKAGDPAQAEALYGQIVACAPAHADAWNALAVLRFERGDREEGLSAARKAVALAPEYADTHANLALMLAERGELALAEYHLQRALTLQPEAQSARLTMAGVRRAQGRLDDAEGLLREILKTTPAHPGAHHGLAAVLLARGQIAEGLRHYRRSVADPRMAPLRPQLAGDLARNGLPKETPVQLKEILRNDPNDLAARHLLAALENPQGPRANEMHVRRMFESCAEPFEMSLAADEYRAPQVVAGAAELCLGRPEGTLDVLDAGCGAGLLGPLIRPYSIRLTGVDSSAGELSRARRIGCYNALVESELIAYLKSVPEAFDLVASASALSRIGALGRIFEAVMPALRAGGWLLFSVEEGPVGGPDFNVHLGGRYAHRQDYVDKALAAAGFVETRMAHQTLRVQQGQPVAGLIYAARRPGGQKSR